MRRTLCGRADVDASAWRGSGLSRASTLVHASMRRTSGFWSLVSEVTDGVGDLTRAVWTSPATASRGAGTSMPGCNEHYAMSARHESDDSAVGRHIRGLKGSRTGLRVPDNTCGHYL
jgi:hypothetical protein